MSSFIFAVGFHIVKLYLLLCGNAPAAGLLFPAGFALASGFPQLVALTRSAPSRFTLSTRLAMMVGGTWGAAGIAFLLMGKIAARNGLRTALFCGVLCYAGSLALAWKRRR